jgi:threonine/homoserine/homoserine lactone efflux protein
VRTFISQPNDQAASIRKSTLTAAYGSTFVLTLTNPITILSFIPVFAGLGLGRAADYGAASATVLGVFVGSTLWWVVLSTSVASLRAWLGGSWMRTVNYISGSMITAFGIVAIVDAFHN